MCADYNKNIIDHAKSKFKNINFVEGSATELPFEDESFDMIVNVESLHHYKFTQYYYKEGTWIERDTCTYCLWG